MIISAKNTQRPQVAIQTSKEWFRFDKVTEQGVKTWLESVGDEVNNPRAVKDTANGILAYLYTDVLTAKLYVDVDGAMFSISGINGHLRMSIVGIPSEDIRATDELKDELIKFFNSLSTELAA